MFCNFHMYMHRVGADNVCASQLLNMWCIATIHTDLICIFMSSKNQLMHERTSRKISYSFLKVYFCTEQIHISSSLVGRKENLSVKWKL